MVDSRWRRLGIYPKAQPQPTRWQSRDLRGPLPRHVALALATAIASLPKRGPWPEIDEEAWWTDVLTDPRTSLPAAKRLSEKHENANLRLDRCPAKSLTFRCQRCGSQATVTLAELMDTFGRDRNVRTIGRHILGCKDKRAHREGRELSDHVSGLIREWECTLTHRADIAARLDLRPRNHLATATTVARCPGRCCNTDPASSRTKSELSSPEGPRSSSNSKRRCRPGCSHGASLAVGRAPASHTGMKYRRRV